MHAFAALGVDVLAKENEPPVVPGAIVAYIEGQKGVYVRNLGGIPEGEMPTKPLAVGPYMIILRVFGQHGSEEW